MHGVHLPKLGIIIPFMGIKTFGLADMLRVALKPLEKHVAVVFLYGSIAKYPDLAYDVADIMIISNGLSSTDVISHLAKVESRIGCKINPSIYSVRELGLRLAGGNTFLIAVMKQPKIFLIGSEDDIPTMRPRGREIERA